ncbi:hypothetical protein SLA2020_416210 [Shorea laevis]
MSRLMRNMRRTNNMHHDQLRHARQARHFPYGPNHQIACRICGLVFTSNQALVDHIQAHIRQDDTVSLLRRRQGMINTLLSSRTLLFANSYSFNLPNSPLFSPRQFNNLRRRPYPPPPVNALNPTSFMPQLQPNPYSSSFNGTLAVPATVPIFSTQQSQTTTLPHSGSLFGPSPQLQTTILAHSGSSSAPSPQLQTTVLPHSGSLSASSSPQLQTTILPHPGSLVQRRSPVQEPPLNDHARPFLSQLEHERENEYDEGSSSSSELDLTLKL